MEELQNVESADPPVDAVTAAPHPSAIRKVFRNRFDQWRAGWRILVYLILRVPFTGTWRSRHWFGRCFPNRMGA